VRHAVSSNFVNGMC